MNGDERGSHVWHGRPNGGAVPSEISAQIENGGYLKSHIFSISQVLCLMSSKFKNIDWFASTIAVEKLEWQDVTYLLMNFVQCSFQILDPSPTPPLNLTPPLELSPHFFVDKTSQAPSIVWNSLHRRQQDIST